MAEKGQGEGAKERENEREELGGKEHEFKF